MLCILCVAGTHFANGVILRLEQAIYYYFRSIANKIYETYRKAVQQRTTRTANRNTNFGMFYGYVHANTVYGTVLADPNRNPLVRDHSDVPGTAKVHLIDLTTPCP